MSFHGSFLEHSPASGSRFERRLRSPALSSASPLPPRPSPSQGHLRLAPLAGASPVPRATSPGGTPQPPSLATSPALPSARRQSSPAGHLGAVWGMRRSTPSAACDWWQPQLGTLPRGSWERMAELAGPGSPVPTARPLEAQTPPRAPQDMRVRRMRRPADLGASSLGGVGSSRRGQSCAGAAKEALGEAPAPVARPHTPPCSARCGSVPPTGTVKADEDAAALAKARAVAALQRLFFEEMAKGGQDANGAAAAALRRLSEVPSQAPAPGAMAAAPVAAPRAPTAQVILEIEAEAPEASPPSLAGSRQVVAAPRRPSSPVLGRKRRPCPSVSRVAIQA
mmetsp:Transcript_99911/g.213923  ORF Transcript_99911/g.213923 Transcript_99911/m.213923 type:complete len:338 (-) Transcript_99911:256-1269(-)